MENLAFDQTAYEKPPRFHLCFECGAEWEAQSWKTSGLIKVPQSSIKMPQRKSLRFSSPSFRFWVWCKMENSEGKTSEKIFSEISENSEFYPSTKQEACYGALNVMDF